MKIKIQYRVYKIVGGLLERPERWDSYRYPDYDSMEECRKIFEINQDSNEYIILPVTNYYLD